ncbi:MAG: efflux RND transporter periplasmic adaptor subunit [Candidatus Zixiibacteriota bacterium]|nr:MAG: efflux RND transporter periplasmic adaptor subunit [candidate division Zixibacteria bacterium]
MKKIYYVAIVIVAILIGYYAVNAIFTKSYDIPTTRAQRGDFVVALNENGKVDAKRAMTLTSPRVRGLQITWLAEEGSTVKEGDPVIKFDATQQLADLADFESTLKINQSALERAKQEYTIQEKQLKLDLEKAARNYDEKKHEALRVAEEARLEYELAQLNFQAKLDQLRADVEKAEVEVRRASDKVNLAKRDLEQMTINAPIPGLVVYLEYWKGSSMGKVQEGDSPWPGMGLINLPDLSEMLVKTTVSEVDASKVDTGQEVRVVLDAFPEKEYNGKVIKKSTLARRKDHNSQINVFDLEIEILDHDENFKPGMSASASIIIDEIPDVVYVPLEAVFEKDGQTVVYMDNKDRREVAVGRKNDMAVEIVEGLEGGEEVCLVDPTLDEQGLPGDRATEPELNKGNIPAKPETAPPRRGRPGRR